MKLYVLDLGKIVMRGDNPVVDTAQANAEAPAIPCLLYTSGVNEVEDALGDAGVLHN